MTISCHNYPGQNKCDLHYYPDNYQNMFKALKIALKHTRISLPYILKYI